MTMFSIASISSIPGSVAMYLAINFPNLTPTVEPTRPRRSLFLFGLLFFLNAFFHHFLGFLFAWNDLADCKGCREPQAASHQGHDIEARNVDKPQGSQTRQTTTTEKKRGLNEHFFLIRTQSTLLEHLLTYMSDMPDFPKRDPKTPITSLPTNRDSKSKGWYTMG